MGLYDINPANSLSTGVASGAQSGAPFYNNAGIYFGNADIGAVALTGTPGLTLSNPTTANAAAPGGVASVGAPAGLLGTSGGGISTGTIILGAALIGAAVLVAMHMKKKAA